MLLVISFDAETAEKNLNGLNEAFLRKDPTIGINGPGKTANPGLITKLIIIAIMQGISTTTIRPVIVNRVPWMLLVCSIISQIKP
jgi:hypothetical protein